MKTLTTIRSKLIDAGVRNLREFGYPDVTSTNILTDRVYSAFFAKMLDEHQGNQEEVKALKAEIETNAAL